jgi:hypothetical protein
MHTIYLSILEGSFLSSIPAETIFLVVSVLLNLVLRALIAGKQKTVDRVIAVADVSLLLGQKIIDALKDGVISKDELKDIAESYNSLKSNLNQEVGNDDDRLR